MARNSRAHSEFLAGEPVRISKALRRDLEDAIQAHLIAVDKVTAVLDKADGDGDLEPSLGSIGFTQAQNSQEGWGAGNDDDREGDEHDGREPQCEDEGAACEDEGAQCDDEGGDLDSCGRGYL